VHNENTLITRHENTAPAAINYFTIDEECSQFTSQLTKNAHNAQNSSKEAQNAQ
jgi:hypothetical protein